MNLFAYHLELKQMYSQALELYQKGERNIQQFFSEQQLDTMSKLGVKPMDFYDFAEDYIRYQEPTWDTFLTIHTIRRHYFLLEQKGHWSTRELDPETLPGKKEELEGIAWLPRIIEKAKGKLKGELSSDIMYCCSGDRKFLKTYKINPSYFLQAVWFFNGDPQKIRAWDVFN